MALATLWQLGLIATARDQACRVTELVSGVECARKAGHEPFPHAGMWQGADSGSWVVTVWSAT